LYCPLKSDRRYQMPRSSLCHVPPGAGRVPDSMLLDGHHGCQVGACQTTACTSRFRPEASSVDCTQDSAESGQPALSPTEHVLPRQVPPTSVPPGTRTLQPSDNEQMPIRSDLPGPQGTLLTRGTCRLTLVFGHLHRICPVRTTAAAVAGGYAVPGFMSDTPFFCFQKASAGAAVRDFVPETLHRLPESSNFPVHTRELTDGHGCNSSSPTL